MGRILVVDEHDAVQRGLAHSPGLAGHDIERVASYCLAMDRLRQDQFDIIVADIDLGGPEALDLLRSARLIQAASAVILITAEGSLLTAVEAMHMGAFDFVRKPFEIGELELRVARAVDFRRLRHQVDYLRHTQPDIYHFDRIVGANGGLKEVLTNVRRIARGNAAVLISGEAGTGKTLIAAAIHHNSSRANRPCVKIDCAALDEERLASELFGHEKGAFGAADRGRIGRLEQADGGTLVLEKIDQISDTMQIKLLRVLLEGEFQRVGGARSTQVDVRTIATTSRDLPALVRNGCFHKELFYRLNATSAALPALREREADIPALVDFFVRRFTTEFDQKVDSVSADTLDALCGYLWPGNVRELENVIERAVLLATGSEIQLADLQLGSCGSLPAYEDTRAVVRIPPTGVRLEEVERQALEQALKLSNWVQKDAAELIGISPRVMGYKIRALHIERPRLPARSPGQRSLPGAHWN